MAVNQNKTKDSDLSKMMSSQEKGDDDEDNYEDDDYEDDDFESSFNNTGTGKSDLSKKLQAAAD